MLISRKLKFMLAPAAVAVAAAAVPSVASADAVAQSYLLISNFTFSQNPGGSVTIITAADSGDVSASINGGAAATDSFNGGISSFTLQKQVGPNSGSYAPGIAVTTPTFPALNYVGSYSNLNGGDPFAGNVIAEVDNTVVLNPGGTGTAQSNTNLAATFTLSVVAGTQLSVNFDAAAFLRAALAPFPIPGSANASYNWNINLRNSAGVTVFDWTPNGTATGPTGGTESADPFALSDSRAVTLGGLDFTTGVQTGAFAAQSNSLAAGLYQLNITHIANADAAMAIPEPGALALVALGLIGLGGASRRKKASV